MLKEIGTPENVAKCVERAKDKNDPFRLMGFGHRSAWPCPATAA